MIVYKIPEEIELMIEGGKRLQKVVHQLISEIHSGLKTADIEQKAKKLLNKEGVEPSFMRVPGYKWATCLCINEQTVHTEPCERVIKQGDILTIDIGAYYQGFHTDYATTLVVDEIADEKVMRFLAVGKNTLREAIKKATKGNYIGDISETIEREIQGHGYHIIKSLTGHGVGKELHEDPYIPGFLDMPKEKTPEIKEGMTLAIEVIYSIGSEEIQQELPAKWSLITADRSLSACFEHTVAVTGNDTQILT